MLLRQPEEPGAITEQTTHLRIGGTHDADALANPIEAPHALAVPLFGQQVVGLVAAPRLCHLDRAYYDVRVHVHDGPAARHEDTDGSFDPLDALAILRPAAGQLLPRAAHVDANATQPDRDFLAAVDGGVDESAVLAGWVGDAPHLVADARAVRHGDHRGSECRHRRESRLPTRVPDIA